MHKHFIQHVNATILLFHADNESWEVQVQNMNFSIGIEDFYAKNNIQQGDQITFRHVGFFKFEFYVFRNKKQVKLPDAQGDDGDRQPSDDIDLIYVPMFSIPSKIGLDELSGCRALLIDVVEFCSHPGSLISSSTTRLRIMMK
nr:hypothetical protein Iba_chr05bCG8170 [Ipomoea batatas]